MRHRGYVRQSRFWLDEIDDSMAEYNIDGAMYAYRQLVPIIKRLGEIIPGDWEVTPNEPDPVST